MANKIIADNKVADQKTSGQSTVQRLLQGKVISDKMDKTIVVSVVRSYTDDRLNKVIRTSKNYKVHDEAGIATVGDVVEIYEGRPVSKTKYMYLARIVTQKTTK